LKQPADSHCQRVVFIRRRIDNAGLSLAIALVKLGSMNSEAIQAWIERRPFQPFLMRLAGGETHEIRHPENVILMRSIMVVAYPETERVAFCSLPLVTSIDTPQPA
jgi:hypothetical protein